MTEEEILKKAMAILGSRKSEKKAAAVRENGKKGGRPRKDGTRPDAERSSNTDDVSRASSASLTE